MTPSSTAGASGDGWAPEKGAPPPVAYGAAWAATKGASAGASAGSRRGGRAGVGWSAPSLPASGTEGASSSASLDGGPEGSLWAAGRGASGAGTASASG